MLVALQLAAWRVRTLTRDDLTCARPSHFYCCAMLIKYIQSRLKRARAVQHNCLP